MAFGQLLARSALLGCGGPLDPAEERRAVGKLYHIDPAGRTEVKAHRLSETSTPVVGESHSDGRKAICFREPYESDPAAMGVDGRAVHPAA